MIFNKKLNEEYSEKLASGEARNFDLYHFLSNGFETSAQETKNTATAKL
jgi:hypothetical protein